MKKLIIMLLVLLPLISAHADNVLRVQGYRVPENFQSTLRVEKSSYIEPEELLRQLLTQAPEFDVFTMYSNTNNVTSIIDKGFCLDLSSSKVIRDALSRMHPAIVEYRCRGDAIYAIPVSIDFSSELKCNEEVWQDLGYTEGDVPKSFSAFLDFLETWIIRDETNDLGVDVHTGWDEDIYDEHTYADWLVNYLMRNFINQASYADAMRFYTPELVELLERTRTIGEQIYYYCKPKKNAASNGNRSLFVNHDTYIDGWVDLKTWFVDMRINRNQSMLMPGTMVLIAVYAGTEHPEETIRLMEAFI